MDARNRYRTAGSSTAALVLAALVALWPASAAGQAPVAGREAAPRPIPYPVTPPARYLAALERGTRAPTGVPGPDYWQQYARYALDVRIDPGDKRLHGRGHITYLNRSPDSLETLIVKLYMNHHAEGAVRNRPAEVTGGARIHRMTVDGEPLEEVSPMRRRGRAPEPGYMIRGTVLWILLPSPVAPGDSVGLEMDWGFVVPQRAVGGRMGWEGDNLLFMAYWYPQIAVYDDVVGWHDDPFLGQAEFYSGFADYDLRIDVPEGWVVVGTGDLMNAAEVLPPEIRERLERAARSDEAVSILTAEERGPGSATTDSETDRLVWHLRAERVRDVAFSLTRESVWEAARTPVGDRDGDGRTDFTRVDALYRESAEGWADVVRNAQHAITFFSTYLDFPYPWSHMTAVEGRGLMGGGMEYPMMTLMGGSGYGLTNHELGHMWLPMIVSSDEVRWAWMDEGVTSYNSTQANPPWLPERETNPEWLARTARSGTIMRWTDWQGPQEGFAAYGKPAAALTALRAVLGAEVFDRALRTYVGAWAWKHPKPWDFFAVFEAVSGRDLDWFWRGWFYENWGMDHAIASVEEDGGRFRVTVEDRGDLVMPAVLTATRESGEVETFIVGAERWLSGARTAVVRVPAGSPLAKLELDVAEAFPDSDRSNDVWRAERDGER